MTTLRFPDGSEVLYELTRKPVKNINLRVKEDGSLRISASPRVSLQRVEQFIITEQDFIRRAQHRIAAREEHSGIRADIFRWLGSEYPVRGISSSRECAVQEQEEMRVFTRVSKAERRSTRIADKFRTESAANSHHDKGHEVPLGQLHARPGTHLAEYPACALSARYRSVSRVARIRPLLAPRPLGKVLRLSG